MASTDLQEPSAKAPLSPSQLSANSHTLFIFNLFWLHWVSIAVLRLSLVAVNGGFSLVSWLLTEAASLVVEHGL